MNIIQSELILLDIIYYQTLQYGNSVTENKIALYIYKECTYLWIPVFSYFCH